MDAGKLIRFIVFVLVVFVIVAVAMAGFRLGWFDSLRLPGSTLRREPAKVKLDPRATADCRAYLKQLNAGIKRYARDHRSAPYPWTSYDEMVDTRPPSLPPKYLIVVRACPAGGVYSYDQTPRKVFCSISEHNP